MFYVLPKFDVPSSSVVPSSKIGIQFPSPEKRNKKTCWIVNNSAIYCSSLLKFGRPALLQYVSPKADEWLQLLLVGQIQYGRRRPLFNLSDTAPLVSQPRDP